jgi:thioredoxin-dependent peroxiredoxin
MHYVQNIFGSSCRRYLNEVAIGMLMKAPDFTLRDQNNKPVSLRQFRGKKVVLYFYPKADTPGCTVQACGIRDNSKAFDALNAVVIGISPDDVSDLKAFEKHHTLNFILLADPSHEVLTQYNVWREKSFMGRRFMGVERSTVLIDENGDIIKRYEKVNPVSHAGMLIADLGGAPGDVPIASIVKPQAVAAIKRAATKPLSKPKKSARKAVKNVPKKSAKKVAKKAAKKSVKKPVKKTAKKTVKKR